MADDIKIWLHNFSCSHVCLYAFILMALFKCMNFLNDFMNKKYILFTGMHNILVLQLLTDMIDTVHVHTVHYYFAMLKFTYNI